MQRKKILFLTAFEPNNKTAGQNFTLKLLSELSKHCDIDLIYFHYRNDPGYDSPDNVRVIKIFPLSFFYKLINVLKIPVIHPFFSSRFHFRLAWHLFTTRKAYNYFYFDFSQVFIYALCVPGRVKYLMVHDVISQKYSRKPGIINKVNSILVLLSEKVILKSTGSVILCFSNKDKVIIQDYFGKQSRAIDFFIDDKIYAINYDNLRLSGKYAFYGAWNRRENSDGLLWFARHVLPLIDSRIKFIIVGSGVSQQLKQKLSIYPNLEMVGFAENPYDILSSCQGLIAPLTEGAGVKVKVLEALACGTPVIGTEIAFEGIEYDNPKYCFVCTQVDDYIKAIQVTSHYNALDKLQLRMEFLQNYPKQSFLKIIEHEI